MSFSPPPNFSGSKKLSRLNSSPMLFCSHSAVSQSSPVRQDVPACQLCVIATEGSVPHTPRTRQIFICDAWQAGSGLSCIRKEQGGSTCSGVPVSASLDVTFWEARSLKSLHPDVAICLSFSVQTRVLQRDACMPGLKAHLYAAECISESMQ